MRVTDEEQCAVETLTSIAKAYQATAAIEDDSEGGEDVMTQALRRDLPIALSIIGRQAQELKQQKAANIESAAARVKLRPLYKALAHWRYGLFDKVVGKDISAIGGSSSAVYQLAESWDLIERPFGHFIKGEGDEDD